MADPNYFQRLGHETPTQFWHDSGEVAEIQTALANGACGVTTNPILITRTVLAHPSAWQARIRHIAKSVPVQDMAHEVTAQIVSTAADMLISTWVTTQGRAGWVCAQGNPNDHGNAQAMVDEARAFAALRPNVATKIPVSAAGLEAIEELTSQGITTTGTTSFTVPQVLHIAQAYRRGLARRTSHATVQPRSFAVLMAGRLDDHLRDEVRAGRGSASEEALAVAGLAVVKRADSIFRQRGYESVLLVGGMRGNYHVTDLVGGNMVLTVAPAMQTAIIQQGYVPRQTISDPVAAPLLEEIKRVPNFRRAFEPDGMAPAEFSGYGAFVKTQGQFIDHYRQLQHFVQKSIE